MITGYLRNVGSAVKDEGVKSTLEKVVNGVGTRFHHLFFYGTFALPDPFKDTRVGPEILRSYVKLYKQGISLEGGALNLTKAKEGIYEYKNPGKYI